MNISVLIVIFTFMLLIISPGANFLIITNHSLRYGYKVAFFTILGITTAYSIVIPSSLYIVCILESKLALILTIKVLAGMYLIILGLWNIKKAARIKKQLEIISKISRKKAFKYGFINQLSNPQSLLVGFGVLSGLSLKNLNIRHELVIILCISAFAFMWFNFVSSLLTKEKVLQAYYKHSYFIDLAVSGIFILIGLQSMLCIFR